MSGPPVEGTKIGTYTVLEPIKGGGKSQCYRAYAPDGTIVFLKRFLAPLYPVDPGPDKARTAKLRALCDAFAKRHQEIIDLLEPTTHGGGNLVKPLGFLREGGAYYKAYPFLEAEPSQVMVGASPSDKLLVLKTLLLSMRELHSVDVVHADLKPDNVMVKRLPAGTIAKLIDFDEAYVSRQPPSVRSISGDPVFYSPELERYAEGDARPVELTLASDIFSLGIVVNRLFAGAMPTVDGGSGDSCARRVLSGGRLSFARMPYLPAPFESLLPHTVALDPKDRPTIDDLVEAAGLPRLTPPSGPRPSVSPGGAGGAGGTGDRDTGRLVINMGRRSAPRPTR